MADAYYIDSAIWRDLHENRTDKFRPLGEWAFELFRKIRLTQGKALYSNLTVDELSIAYDSKTISGLFETISECLNKVEIAEQQAKEASKLSKERKLPFGDCLHAVLARDNNAILVTRDKHFAELQDITPAKKPEELL